MRQDARKGRSHSHAVKVGNGRRKRRERTIHHLATPGRKASTTRKAPGRQPEGLQRSVPVVTRESQCELYP